MGYPCPNFCLCAFWGALVQGFAVPATVEKGGFYIGDQG